ncbi:hypothetical protein TanjilG_03006 [Lupinus angustifolius]|uniref:TCP domain-containing protein n=1 Tax=Lupinus angustifolius TaxID=3871 RepID=A0A4P1RD16_LUPAN|nr:PREDICTED: transcription factor TCP4-like [Lupinus angustifolius]XP_019449058.1 PREDICTED: transcription factor TCP4-like [Lupinus angustifolius]XP_019449059.1 PREDICTED: transcription factor TCP4-like [Lupinus angustifolius]XP_019449060.1 PREDICTED: transcription factor TCP4-like [Lupinus angustifolius]OIW08330.1 hypothetical protein TanjilG_03006 [Lupinus angustifolius]
MSQHQYFKGKISNQIEQTQDNTLNRTIEHTKHNGGTMGMRNTGGEIVQVEGGHIIRSTNRKDRHSKVYTSKGPRDRRVRLSAHTAIEFYDVQDRLGYDRPSKAVDWLIKKAKPSIDKLAELPPWNPTSVEEHNAGSSDMSHMTNAKQSESCGYNFQLQRQLGETENSDKHSALAFIQPHMDTTDPIALFPTTPATSSFNFQSYPPDIISRANNSSQDLGLSLHSFHNHTGLILGQSQQAAVANQTPSSEEHQSLFVGSAPVGFENHYQRIMDWNNEAFMVNSHQFLGQGNSGSAYSQSGTTLQSNFSPLVRSWNDIPMNSSEHQRSQNASIFGSRFLSDHGLAGFSIQEANHRDDTNNPSPSHPNSHH